MSLLIGIVHADGRPISQTLTSGENDDRLRSWCTRGVMLAAAEFSHVGGDGDQPYVTPEGSITFDGRVDNPGELRTYLADDLVGEASDAGMALALYLRHGAEGLCRLIGDWSLAIWDPNRRSLVLASDYAGVRPLYYHADTDRIVWSTDLKKLIQCVRPCCIDDEYVAGLLTTGGFPDVTPYPGVLSVRPGHYLTYCRGRAELHSFWQPPIDRVIRYRHESEYEEHLFEVFREAVKSRLNGDGPALSELSGGLDSSSVVCMAKYLIENGDVHPKSFATISYERQGSLDTPFYTAVEKWSGFASIHLSVEKHAFLSECDTGDVLPAFWSSLHSAVNAEARGIGARTLLTGSLGDLIMGNWWDDSAQVSGFLRDGHIRAALRQSLAWSRALRVPIGGVLWRALLRLMPSPLIASRAELFSDEDTPSGPQEDSIASSFRARMDLKQKERGFSRAWMKARPERMKHVRGLLETIELRRLQPPEPLGRLSYTHPYAHRPLVEYMLSIPAEIVCGPGEPRRLMRRTFCRFWPPLMTGRRSKDSFDGAFLAALCPLVPRLLKDVERLQVVQRGYIDSVSLKTRLDALAYSLDCNAAQLRRIILLELWLQRWFGIRR